MKKRVWVVLCVSACLVTVSAARSSAQSQVDPVRLSLGAGGDVSFGRYHKSRRYLSHGGAEPFQYLRPLFAQADLVLVNLETPLMDGDPKRIRQGRWPKKSILFRGDTRYAELLKQVGVTGVSLANNHAEDCGRPGLKATETALAQAGVLHPGVSVDGDPYAPVIFEAQGHRVVWFARSHRRNHGPIDTGKPFKRIAFETLKDTLRTSVKMVKTYRQRYPNALFLFSLHWGAEYSERPSNRQVKVARALIDAGVHAVLGHHAHVVQPVEVHGAGVIFYNMGNLLFDHHRKDARRSGFFFGDFIQNGAGSWRVAGVRVVPLEAPIPPEPARVACERVGKEILDRLQRDSGARRHKTVFTLGEGVAVWERAAPQSP